MIKLECCKEGLWLTAMGRIVLDNHNNETFCEPYDKKLMTKEELEKGIKFIEFEKRMIEAVGIRGRNKHKIKCGCR